MLQMKNPGGKKFQPYKEGDQVWVKGTNLKTPVSIGKARAKAVMIMH
jgi:hypothetical protein